MRDTVSSISAVLDNRIRQLEGVLRHLVVDEVADEDGIAEPGMVLTIRDNDTGEVETFLLAVRDDGYGDLKSYSMFSPVGTAVFGARPGEQRTYRASNGEMVSVTLLKAVPYGAH
jgi:transcription elongation GreA/GreB family factor